MSAPPDLSTHDRPVARPGALRRDERLLTALVWTALLLAPVLFLIETTGPRWLNLTLRGVWVVVVVAVAGLVLRGRARLRRPEGDGVVA